MSRSRTPRAAVVLLVTGVVFALLGLVAFVTSQPLAVQDLALGTGAGLNIATLAMLGELRKLQGQDRGGTT